MVYDPSLHYTYVWASTFLSLGLAAAEEVILWGYSSSSEERSRRQGLWPPTNPLQRAGRVSEPRTQVPSPGRAFRWLHFYLKSWLQAHDRKNCPLSWIPAPEKLWLITNVYCRFKPLNWRVTCYTSIDNQYDTTTNRPWSRHTMTLSSLFLAVPF